MRMDRTALAGAVAALLLVAACGGSASSAPTTGPGASSTPAAAESQSPAETQEPVGTSEPTQGGLEPSLIPGAAGDLEARLPSEVNGVKFQKVSFDGASIPGGIPIGDGNDDLTKFLADNGKSLSDVKVAMATPLDAAASGSLVMAIQVKGAPSDKLLAWATKGTDSAEKTTIGGKEVYGAAAGGFGAYFYVKDDVVYYILSMDGDAKLAEGILKQLP